MSTAKPKVSSAMQRKRILRKSTPKFQRHAVYRKKRLQNNAHYKKPRGLHNKQKDNKKNRFPKVSDGYRTPVEVRGLHISGLAIAYVSNVQDLAGIDAATTGVVIKSVGAKKQLAILHECAKHKIRVLNHKSESRIAQLEKKREEQQASLDAARKQKAAKNTKTSKKAVEEKLTEEEKKEEQDKIKEQVLTKGEQ